MASTISNTAINEAILSNEQKKVLMLVNAGTAAALDVSASNLSVDEKAICQQLVAGTATRQSIAARPGVDLAFKAVAYAIANV